MNKEMSKLN